MWLALALALASALAVETPSVGHVVMAPSSDARIRVMPRTDPQMVQVGVFDNVLDLEPQVKMVAAQWLLDLKAQSAGSGVWFLTFYVENDTINVTWEPLEDGRIRFDLTPTFDRDGVPDVRKWTLDQLITGEHERVILPPPNRAPLPLAGALNASLSDPSSALMRIPDWSELELPTVSRELKLPAPKPTWADVSQYRRLMIDPKTRHDRPVATYRLATTLSQLNHDREALVYAEQLLDSSEEFPADLIHATVGKIAVNSSDWDLARESCQTAHVNGAPPTWILDCMGAVSLATGSPPPAETAAAILQHQVDPLSRILAAQLLLIDGRNRDASLVLQQLLPAISSSDALAEWEGRAVMLLGDAFYGAGEVRAADEAWAAVSHRHAMYPIAQVRRIMADMAMEPVSKWQQFQLELNPLVNRPPPQDPNALRAWAEAHFLLSQLHELHGSPIQAIEHTGHILSALPEARTDIPTLERLAGICDAQLSWLDRSQDHMGQLGFFQDCWRSELINVTDNTEHMGRIAQLFEDAGLLTDALEVTRDRVSVHTRHYREDPETLLYLAHLYARMNLDMDATATLLYVEDSDNPPDRDRLALARADVYGWLGKADLERDAWERLLTTDHRDQARVRLALLDAEAGTCLTAIDNLPIEPDLTDPLGVRIVEARVRCLVSDSAFDQALLEANVLASSPHPGVAERGAYLVAVAAQRGRLDADVDVAILRAVRDAQVAAESVISEADIRR